MSVFKTKGVILKAQDYKENDKLIWIFTEKLGKITAIAKGAKKGSNRLRASTLPFCFGEYVVYRGKTMYTLNEASIIDSFQDLMGNIETLTYTSYLNELIEISLPDEESNRELFKIFVTAYYLMKNKVGDEETLIRAFEIKLLQHTGYNLDIEHCCMCRKKINMANHINLQYFGPVCGECEHSNSLKIRNSTYNALKFLSKFSVENFYRIKLDDNTKKELYVVLSNIISQIYSRRPKSLDFLSLLKKE